MSDVEQGPAATPGESPETAPPAEQKNRGGRYDVFLSYTQTDARIASAARAALEASGIRTFMAPGMTPGEQWLVEIPRAIAESRLMVLILSGPSSNSDWVLREVACAAEKGKLIIPFQIDDGPLAESMKLLVRTVQWLVAVPPPAEDYFPSLCQTVSARLAIPGDEPTSPRSGRPVIRIAWPNSRSYFATGETQTIQWEAFAGVRSTIRRFEIELYLDKEDTCLDHLAGGSESQLAGDARAFAWPIARNLKAGFKYRVKMLAWDSQGQVGFAFSEPFTISSTFEETRGDLAWTGVLLGGLLCGMALYKMAVALGTIHDASHAEWFTPIVYLLVADIGAVVGWATLMVLNVSPLAARIVIVGSLIAGCLAGWSGATFAGFPHHALDATLIGGFWGTLFSALWCSARYRKSRDFAIVCSENVKFWSRIWERAIDFTAKLFVRN